MSARKSAQPRNEAASTPDTCALYAPRLLAWFDIHGRHDLPWTEPRTPYRVWLSEIMLQQTQVTTVIPYFQRFVDALPDLPALATAPPDTVLALWSGLGYYSRARNLHAAAKLCMERHGGELPRDFDALHALPGIGRSTAAAILAQAWGEPFAILDGNVKRVLARLHGIEGWPGLPAVEKRLWAIAEASLPSTPATRARMADYTQAQMDLGATLCTRSRPRCGECPLAEACVAYREGRTAALPSPRPKKAIPQRETHMVWLRDAEGRTLLQRRPATGVWASLWSLPEAADAGEAVRIAGLHTDIAEAALSRGLPPVDHVFTHFRLRIHPQLFDGVAAKARLGDNDGLRWVAREEFATLGIPAPVSRLIEEDAP